MVDAYLLVLTFAQDSPLSGFSCQLLVLLTSLLLSTNGRIPSCSNLRIVPTQLSELKRTTQIDLVDTEDCTAETHSSCAPRKRLFISITIEDSEGTVHLLMWPMNSFSARPPREMRPTLRIGEERIPPRKRLSLVPQAQALCT